ncbi:MAG TPA: fibronectin type III domain-containing protein [Pseudonocardiaceae bacterium]
MRRGVVATLAAGLLLTTSPANATNLANATSPANDPNPRHAAGREAVAAGGLAPPWNVRPGPTEPTGTVVAIWDRPDLGDGSDYTLFQELPDGTTVEVARTHDKGYVFHYAGSPGAAGLCYRVRRTLNGTHSPLSAPGCGHASGASPVAPPGPLTVVPLNPERMYVSWVRPVPGDGSTYEVHLRDGERWLRRAVVGDQHATHVTGLGANTTYCFGVVRLRAGVRSGWSPMGCGTTP